MEEEKKFHWCWDRCKWVDKRVCEARIQKGKCRILDKPRDPVAEIRGVFHKEKGEIQYECEEV